MKKIIFLFLLVAFVFVKPQAQTQTPGLDVLGYGYDVFGNYADQNSKKRYCLFKYSDFSEVPIGSYRYSVPKFFILENISKNITKTVSGESIRDYARSLSSEVGLSGETMFFKGSINSSFNSSTSGTEQKFYYSYMDANTKWRVSFDERDLPMLKSILDPRFKQDLMSMEPTRLFELYGTHYIASAYLGGRADLTSESVISNQTNTTDISVAIEASYKMVSGNTSLDSKYATTLKKAQTQTNLTVVGGNSQYANDIKNNPETYRLWADGIERMPVLCDFDKNSLKPIWEFCENSTRRDQLKAAFIDMCNKPENKLPVALVNLIAVTNSAYMIKNKVSGTYWDQANVNPINPPKAGKISLYKKDSQSNKDQGFDRLYRFEPSDLQPEWVSIHPQNTSYVLDIIGGVMIPGTQIQLWDFAKDSDPQLFKLVPVDGEANTFYIQTKNGLCIEYSSSTGESNDSPVKLNTFTKAENQKWIFEDFDPKNIMQPKVGAYTIQCADGGKFWDFTGVYPAVRDNKLNLWGPGNAIGDRTMKIERVNDYFTIRPMHHPTNLLTANDKSQLFTAENEASSKQYFSFEYGGQPNTYLIINKANNEAIDANIDKTNANGCQVASWTRTGAPNQRWILHGPFIAKTPIHEGTYYVRSEGSNKFWDLSGNENESNRNGAKAQIWDQDGGKDRKLSFEPCDDDLGYYRLKFGNGRYMDVSGSWSKDGHIGVAHKEDRGAKLQCYESTNNDAQKFKIIHLGHGVFAFLSKINGRAIDVSGDLINVNGTNLNLWDYNANKKGQRFVLISTTDNKPYNY